MGNSDLRELDGSEDLVVDIDIKHCASPPGGGKENSGGKGNPSYWDLPRKSPTSASLNRGIRNFERTKGLSAPR